MTTPQDPETRIHDDKYMEYANVINRESKILWNETSDNDAQDERDEDEDGYVYESYWHVERLTLKAAHKENTDMFSWFRFFRRGQNGSNVEIKFSSPGVAKLRNRLRLIFINLMAK